MKEETVSLSSSSSGMKRWWWWQVLRHRWRSRWAYLYPHSLLHLLVSVILDRRAKVRVWRYDYSPFGLWLFFFSKVSWWVWLWRLGVERKEARDTIIFASDREKLHFPETARVKDDEIDWREKRERERGRNNKKKNPWWNLVFREDYRDHRQAWSFLLTWVQWTVMATMIQEERERRR